MIDDFWFTDCTCPQCDAARRLQTVNLSGRTFHVEGQTWEDYRRGLMWRLSQERILAPARKVNPNVKVDPQVSGVVRPLAGTRLRRGARDRGLRQDLGGDRNARPRPGRQRALPGVFHHALAGRAGRQEGWRRWYDPLKTTPPTYLEQARQTVLAGARESMLFSYGVLDARAARPTSRRCAPASRSCWLPPSRCACARRLGSPPINRPTVTAQASRIFLGTPECWAAAAAHGPVSGGGSGGVLLDARAEGPGAHPQADHVHPSGRLRCSPRVWRNSSTRRS